MLTAYIVCAVLGGGLAVLSAFFGGDADADADLDASGDADAGHGAEAGTWLPFLSIQFWIFALAVFGIVGTTLRLALGTTLFMELAAAVPTALLTGAGVSWTIRSLRQSQISSSLDERAWLGCEGVVLFPISAKQQGKIRVVMHEREHELLALTDEEEPMAPGEKVVVIELEEGRARVQRAGFFLPNETDSQD